MSESVKDLSFALFTGIFLDEKYANEERAKRNRDLIYMNQKAILTMFDETLPEV
jgi:hypothetical protein